MGQVMYNGQMVETIDCTPTWSGLVGLYIAAIQNGTGDGAKSAIQEIVRMAKVADQGMEVLDAYNKLVKEFNELEEKLNQLTKALSHGK